MGCLLAGRATDCEQTTASSISTHVAGSPTWHSRLQRPCPHGVLGRTLLSWLSAQRCSPSFPAYICRRTQPSLAALSLVQLRSLNQSHGEKFRHQHYALTVSGAVLPRCILLVFAWMPVSWPRLKQLLSLACRQVHHHTICQRSVLSGHSTSLTTCLEQASIPKTGTFMC